MLANGNILLIALFILSDLALIAGLWVRSERFSWRAIPLVFYLLLQAAWALSLYLTHPGLTPNPAGMMLLAEHLTVFAPITLLAATLAFIQAKRGKWSWLFLPTACASAVLALDARGMPLTISGITTRDSLRLVAAGLAWALAFGLAIGLAWHARVSTSSPLHRNRLLYWAGAVVLAAIGTAMVLARPDISPLIGGVVTLCGSALAVLTWRIYYLPDVRVALRRAVSYAIITLITFVIYLLGIRVAQLASLGGAQSELGPLFGAVLVAGVLAVAYAPLRQAVQGLTQRVFGDAAVDYTASLQDYSRHITQVLYLQPVAVMAVETAREALGISRGALFLAEDDVNSGLTLRAVGGSDIEPGGRLVCPGESPITQHWRSGGGPLWQYDVDVLPRYRLVSPAERAALSGWKMEVFLPIRVMEQLVGVLALGSKRSRDPYFDSDVAYLTALADETGVALQHARLFSELREANRHMAEMNRSLERANEQLKELDKLKSAFIGVITHELRSPFAALDFSMQLIQKYGLDNLLPEQREQLQQLAEGLKRAETMINNLITFASFLSKQGQLRLAPVDLKQLAEETLATLEPIARKRDVTLTLQFPEGMPPVCGDRDRLAEAIYHLTHNAIKFNKSNGTVTIACRVEPESVVVEVTDTGVGIPPDKLPEMWKDFTQLADPLRRGVEGLGLGLPLVRYVVTAHGGQVWARSQPGQGSTFGFSLPTEDAAEE